MLTLKKYTTLLLVLCAIIFVGKVDAADAPLTIYAAASTTGPLKEIVKLYEIKMNTKARCSFGSSGALARQIEQGAPADIYISASKKWADYLDEKKLLKAGTRTNFLTNSLVLIAPKDTPAKKVELTKGSKFPVNFSGYLSIGDPEHVPAGRYAKEALTSLDWWIPLSNQLVLAKDVREALLYVEQGEAEYGIVYGSDALKSDKIQTIAVFPEDTHKPIVYVVASVAGTDTKVDEFVKFLSSSEDVKKIFKSYGFIPKK